MFVYFNHTNILFQYLIKCICIQHFFGFPHLGNCFHWACRSGLWDCLLHEGHRQFCLRIWLKESKLRRLPFGICFALVVQLWCSVLSSVMWSFWVLVNDPVLILRMCYFKNTKSYSVFGNLIRLSSAAPFWYVDDIQSK